MKRINKLLLILILTVFISGYGVSARVDMNVDYNEEKKTAAVSGTVDEKYAGAAIGLYITAKDAPLPDFDSGEHTDMFISLQETVVEADGSFSFETMKLSEAEGNIDFNVSVILDASGETGKYSMYIPTREALNNFLDLMDSAQSGEDVLALINANLDGSTVDEKNVDIGLSGDIYTDYTELDKADVADMLLTMYKKNPVSTAVKLNELHIRAALTCAFINSASSEEVWEFINVDSDHKYYKEITSALNPKALKKNSVIKKLESSAAERQEELISAAKGSGSLQEWIEAAALEIINSELSDATNSYVQFIIENYSDVLTAIDYTEYDDVAAYHSSIASDILKNKPYISISDICDVANDSIDEAVKKKKKAQSGGGGGGGGGGGSSKDFSSQVVPVEKPEVEVKPDDKPQNNDTKPETPVFNDLEDVEWAKEAITSLYEKNVVNGKAEGMFCPNDNITREEFVKILTLAFDVYNPDAKCEFIDAPEDAWYYTYAASAFESGFVNGISETQFGTGKNITREDAATMIYRVLKDKKEDLPEAKDISFSDKEEISAYAAEAVSTLSQYKIINGISETQFSPKGMCTRAQVAKMIYEALRR